jgi:glycosyltransferase involved in cell wall biosynthesis
MASPPLTKKLKTYFEALRLASKKPIASEHEIDFLRKIFAPAYYRKIVGLEKHSNQRLFDHFLRFGLSRNASPTPLFDTKMFEAQEGRKEAHEQACPAILRWFRNPAKREINALLFFDPNLYASLYPDVSPAGMSPYEHFLIFGAREARQPNVLFDGALYESVAERRRGEEEMEVFAHFLAFGLERGVAPTSALLPVFARTPTARLEPLEAYRRAMAAVTPLLKTLSTDQIELLLHLFNPDTYDGQGALPETASGLVRLEHFLSTGMRNGLEPGPFFENKLYAAQAGIEEQGEVNRLLHFLQTGSKLRIVPSPLFDEVAYASGWQDMRSIKVWGFQHFISHGIFEGRKVDGSDRVGSWSLPPNSAEGRLHNWELFWLEAGFTLPSRSASMAERKGPTLAKSITRLIEDRHLPMVNGLFCAPYYARQAGLSEALDHETLFEHFLEHGAQAELAPGPLFDPVIARKLVGDSAEPTIVSWLNRRRHNWEAPTPYFDKAFYELNYHNEFRGSLMDLFDHFVIHGLKENRAPNLTFDPVWYRSAYNVPEAEQSLPPYLHYLVYGADRGFAPSQMLLATYSVAATNNRHNASNMLAITQAATKWQDKLGSERMRAAIAMFSPYFYDGGGTLPEQASGVERLVHFLEHGLAVGLAPGPLFDPAIYRDAAPAGKQPPFLDYLLNGWPKFVVPTSLFSEASYIEAHADIRQHKIWGFRHFLFHGIFEGRKIDECAKLTVFTKVTDPASAQLNNVRLFWVANGAQAKRLNLPERVGRQQENLNRTLTSDIFAESMKRALALDPAVGDITKGEGYHAPPYHDITFPAISALFDRIANKTYGSIICVPWLRMGGADLVACQLASAVKAALPDENVLILRVDQKNFERPDWILPDIDVAHVSDILGGLPEAVAERMLFVLFNALRPKRIINVNSYRIWRTIERFGERLRAYVDLYAYMFCWDHTERGFRAGYPSLFFPSTGPILTALLTDTEYLRNELLRIYNPPEQIAQRILPLFTPCRTAPPPAPFAELAANASAKRRPSVIWAGRLDRQKRFDIVQAIARKMPDVDFLCWGDAVLDAPPDMQDSPANLVLNPGFKTYEELPMEKADLWLFTSAWEGMPTILIEIAVRGMSVVASHVGGVPELIGPETGYPVINVQDVDAYVIAIREALKDPQGRIGRARRLQEKAISRYSTGRYIEDLRTIFGKEK